MDTNSPVPGSPSRTSDESVAIALREARKEGIFAGLTSGLASVILGANVLRLGRYKSLVGGALTAVVSGYLFTQAFQDTALAKLRAQADNASQNGNTRERASPDAQ